MKIAHVASVWGSAFKWPLESLYEAASWYSDSGWLGPDISFSTPLPRVSFLAHSVTVTSAHNKYPLKLGKIFAALSLLRCSDMQKAFIYMDKIWNVNSEEEECRRHAGWQSCYGWASVLGLGFLIRFIILTIKREIFIPFLLESLCFVRYNYSQ